MGSDSSVFWWKTGPYREINWIGDGQKGVEFQRKAQLQEKTDNVVEIPSIDGISPT